jgi:hypothetical protein
MILAVALLLKNIFPNAKSRERYLKADVYHIYFNGVVKFIDEGRGFKVGLKNDSFYYDLDGTCNDTACLEQNITWGDTLSKQANSDTIILKSKSNGKLSIWKLPANNKQNR